MANLSSTLSTKGQAVVPAELRAALQIEPGTVLVWQREGNRLIVEPQTLAVKFARIAALRGITKGGPSMCDELIEERRRDLEREQREGW